MSTWHAKIIKWKVLNYFLLFEKFSVGKAFCRELSDQRGTKNRTMVRTFVPKCLLGTYRYVAFFKFLYKKLLWLSFLSYIFPKTFLSFIDLEHQYIFCSIIDNLSRKFYWDRHQKFPIKPKIGRKSMTLNFQNFESQHIFLEVPLVKNTKLKICSTFFPTKIHS